MCNKENKVRFHINWKIRVTPPQENRESEGTVKETPSDKQGLKQVGPTVKREMFQNIPLIMRPTIMSVYSGKSSSRSLLAESTVQR